MPSIEVEELKKFIHYNNYFASKLDNIYLIAASRNIKQI